METRTVSIRNGMFTRPYMTGGRGRPLVYLHGAFGNQHLPLFDRLAEHFTVYAPWHPGWAPVTPDDLQHLDDLIDLALYYQDFFDALELEQPVLVGHSLGGMFAAETAALSSPCVSRLVLIAPLGFWNEAYPVPDFFTYGPDATARALFADPQHPLAVAMAHPPTEGDELIAYHLERAKSLATSAKYLWPIPNRGLSKRLHRVSMPTLLLWGERDPICPPRYADDFRALIPHARLELISGAAHLPHVEQPERTAELVRSFLGERA